MLERFDCVPLFFAPFVSSVMRIEPHWIDYNGHLNMAYYNVLFDRAVDETYELIGVGADYVAKRAHSVYTAEVHVRYLRELHAGDTYVIPSDVPHDAVTGLEGATVIDVFAPIRADWEKLQRLDPAPGFWP